MTTYLRNVSCVCVDGGIFPRISLNATQNCARWQQDKTNEHNKVWKSLIWEYFWELRPSVLTFDHLRRGGGGQQMMVVRWMLVDRGFTVSRGHFVGAYCCGQQFPNLWKNMFERRTYSVLVALPIIKQSVPKKFVEAVIIWENSH